MTPSPALSRETLDRLVTLGRSRGGLTTKDLRAALPIESMDADDLALVVVHLEEAGVPVELDETLFGLTGGAPKLASAAQAGEVVLPPIDNAAGEPQAIARALGGVGSADSPSPPAAPSSDAHGMSLARRAVVIGGLAALMLLVVLIALARR